MAHFTVENLTFSFPQSTKNALQDVTFSVERGEYILVCGLSGSGKSTLLRHLKAELTPHGERSGSVIAPQTVGVVMQDPDAQKPQLISVCNIGSIARQAFFRAAKNS